MPPKTPQDLGREFEKDFARRLGAKVVPGSGNLWHSKLDVQGSGFLWSLKATTKESFRLTRGMLHEAVRAVIAPGGKGGATMPALGVRIQEEDYVILRFEDFLKIVTEDIRIVQPTKADDKRGRASVPKFLRDKE